MNTQGAFSYRDLMAMELAEFDDVIIQLNIRDSAEKQEESRASNHANAIGR